MRLFFLHLIFNRGEFWREKYCKGIPTELHYNILYCMCKDCELSIEKQREKTVLYCSLIPFYSSYAYVVLCITLEPYIETVCP